MKSKQVASFYYVMVVNRAKVYKNRVLLVLVLSGAPKFEKDIYPVLQTVIAGAINSYGVYIFYSSAEKNR